MRAGIKRLFCACACAFERGAWQHAFSHASDDVW